MRRHDVGDAVRPVGPAHELAPGVHRAGHAVAVQQHRLVPEACVCRLAIEGTCKFSECKDSALCGPVFQNPLSVMPRACGHGRDLGAHAGDPVAAPAGLHRVLEVRRGGEDERPVLLEDDYWPAVEAEVPGGRGPRTSALFS